MVYLQRNKTSVIGKGVVVCLELIKFHKTTTPTTRTNKPECERKENKRKEEKRREEKRREEKRREKEVAMVEIFSTLSRRLPKMAGVN